MVHPKEQSDAKILVLDSACSQPQYPVCNTESLNGIGMSGVGRLRHKIHGLSGNQGLSQIIVVETNNLGPRILTMGKGIAETRYDD